MEDKLEFRTNAQWTSDRNGVLHAEGVPQFITFSAPPEFYGKSGQWTPEHLLIGAAASCFVATLGAIAEFSKFKFLVLTVDVAGTLEKNPEGWKLAEIQLQPALIVSRDEDRERAERLIEKAEKACIVARSLACRVVVEPVIQVQTEEEVSVSNFT